MPGQRAQCSHFLFSPSPCFKLAKSSGNILGQEHQFQSGVVYAMEMQPLKFLIQGLHFCSVNHPGLELVFLSKNVTRGHKQPTADTTSCFKQNKSSHCVITSLK